MKTILHKSMERGHADHGWLKSDHSFSFAGYYDSEKMGFGALRVLNDDRVAAGMGFGAHPHDNMEIISIPLMGSLKHKDDMGNISIIKSDEVQIMSAGTGVTHSELNNSRTEEVNFLQLWILPKERNITPRYDQKYFEPQERINQWQRVVSPEDNGALWINQDAHLSRATVESGKQLAYDVKGSNRGVYIFLLEGSVKIGDQKLERRDAIGIYDSQDFSIEALEESELLAIEVPLN